MVIVPGGAIGITEREIHSEWVCFRGGTIFSEGVLPSQNVEHQRRIWWSLRGCICFEYVKFSQGYLAMDWALVVCPKSSWYWVSCSMSCWYKQRCTEVHVGCIRRKVKVFFFWPGVKIDEESVGVLHKSEYEEVSKFNGSKISETQKSA